MKRNAIILVVFLAASAWGAGCNGQPVKKEISPFNSPRLAEEPVPANIIKLARGDHIALLERGLKRFRSRGVKDYTCTFVKQERLHGRLGRVQDIKIKFMPSPFSIAMTWTKNAPIGDALVYVEGRYKDKKGRSRMVVRPKDAISRLIVGKSVLRPPDGPDAMRNTLRPCTMFGFENGFKSLLEVYRLGQRHGELKQRYDGVREINGRACVVLVRVLDKKRPGYPCKTTYIPIDVETLLPVRMIGYDWRDELYCNYEYRDLKFNVGLSGKDFTPQANSIWPPKVKGK